MKIKNSSRMTYFIFCLWLLISSSFFLKYFYIFLWKLFIKIKYSNSTVEPLSTGFCSRWKEPLWKCQRSVCLPHIEGISYDNRMFKCLFPNTFNFTGNECGSESKQERNGKANETNFHKTRVLLRKDWK